MKILHVYRTYFPDTPGGLQEAIRQIALSTKKKGTDSKIFCLSPNPYPSELIFEEAEVVRAKSWITPGNNDIGLFKSLFEYKKLTKWADIIHFHFPWPFADLLHLFISPKKPAIMTYHCDVMGKKYLFEIYRPILKIMLKKMKKIIATSPNNMKSSKVLQSVEDTKLMFINYGLDESQYKKYMSNENLIDIEEKFGLENGRYFLFLGILREYKGLRFLYEASNKVEFKIAVAGGGQHGNEASVNKLKEDSLKYKNISLLGEISNEEKMALIKGCRGLILPSHSRAEAFGIVLLEASIMKKPLISCEIGTGTSFANIDSETGFVVEPEKPELLAKAMKKLMNDEELAIKLGIGARRRFDEMFTAEKVGQSYFEIYKEVLNE